MRAAPLLLAGLALALVAPAPAAAQAIPVDACERQCRPTDADVNPAPVGDGPVHVILYAHVFDFIGWSPMTTQRPEEVRAPPRQYAALMPTVVAPPLVNFDSGPVRLSPNLHAVGPAGYEGATVTFNGPQAVELSSNAFPLYLYLSAEAAPNGLEAGAGAARVEVRARWLASTPAGTEVLASGATPPLLIHRVPGGPLLTEVRVDLTAAQPRLPDCGSGQRLHCRIEVSLHQVEADPARFVQREWRLHAGPSHPWRLILPVSRPMWTENLQTSHQKGAIFVEWNIRNPLGAYDVDATSVRMEVVDGGETLWQGPPILVDTWPRHHADAPPARVLWILPSDLLGRHERELRFHAVNAQGTFVLSDTGTLAADPLRSAQETPAPTGAALLLLLGAILVRRRRSL
jgi:uncharacterized protein (TIGR03382 family)